MASVSVVILNFNGRHHLEKYLPSVLKHSEGHEVVVADNASTDDSIPFLKKIFPKVRLIELEENHGYTGGYNRALDKIDSDYSILLNSDIEVTENWIDPVIRLMESDDSIGLAQPKILDDKNRDKFEYAGASGGFIDKLGYPFCRGRIFDSIEQDHEQYNDTVEIFWASGACLFIRTELFKVFGGFDEDYFAHMEEIDLAWRMKHQGIKAFVCPDSIVYHLGGGTLNYDNPRKTYLNFRNNLFTIFKNSHANDLTLTLFSRFFLDMAAAGKFLMDGNRKSSWAVFQAWGMLIQQVNKLKKKRKRIAPSPTKLDTLYSGSIVVEYFIRKKGKFSDIGGRL